jgi:hypothetical protein
MSNESIIRFGMNKCLWECKGHPLGSWVWKQLSTAFQPADDKWCWKSSCPWHLFHLYIYYTAEGWENALKTFETRYCNWFANISTNDKLRPFILKSNLLLDNRSASETLNCQAVWSSAQLTLQLSAFTRGNKISRTSSMKGFHGPNKHGIMYASL